MRDETIYGLVNQVRGTLQQVVQFVQNFQQAVRLDSTGKEIRLLALQQLLIKKGLITEAEMTEQSGSVIQEMQKQAEEEAKKVNIATPTTEQVQKVAASTTPETPATSAPEAAPVTPPQA